MSHSDNIASIVLAGGKGTRMQSDLPKVLHEISGKPMIFYTLEKLKQLDLAEIIVVVGFKAEQVKGAVSSQFDVKFALQDTPLGTGHAVASALPEVGESIKNILVIQGDDSAFYSPQTLKQFIESHLNSQAVLSLITLKIDTESRLGRVIRDENGNFNQILESAEYEASGLVSNEINCGTYVFDINWLKENVNKIPLSAKGEYYITELPKMAREQNQKINLFTLESQTEWVGVNTQEELKHANSLMSSK